MVTSLRSRCTASARRGRSDERFGPLPCLRRRRRRRRNAAATPPQRRRRVSSLCGADLVLALRGPTQSREGACDRCAHTSQRRHAPDPTSAARVSHGHRPSPRTARIHHSGTVLAPCYGRSRGESRGWPRGRSRGSLVPRDWDIAEAPAPPPPSLANAPGVLVRCIYTIYIYIYIW
jgi:hypothetical protein